MSLKQLNKTPAAVRLCSSTGQVLGGVLGRQETVEALAPFSLKKLAGTAVLYSSGSANQML